QHRGRPLNVSDHFRFGLLGIALIESLQYPSMLADSIRIVIIERSHDSAESIDAGTQAGEHIDEGLVSAFPGDDIVKSLSRGNGSSSVALFHAALHFFHTGIHALQINCP